MFKSLRLLAERVVHALALEKLRRKSELRASLGDTNTLSSSISPTPKSKVPSEPEGKLEA